jgi:predicted small secreted protein
VITTAVNAMYYQKIIENSDLDFREYNALKYIKNVKTENKEIKYNILNINNDTIKDNKNIGFIYNLGSEENTKHQQVTFSKIAASHFPNI